MRISDELREYSITFVPNTKLLNIADRIDAKYEEACREQYNRGYKDGYDEGFASADDWLAWHEDAMAEHGWIRMPVNADKVPGRIYPMVVDANDVPIRIGDVMEWSDGSTAEVVGIGLDTFFYVEDGEDTVEWSRASDKIHHHEPTVEDVLREFAQEMNENLGMYTCEAIDADEWRDADAKTIAEYAAKLKLVDDVKE